MKHYKILILLLVFSGQLKSQDSVRYSQLKDSMECFSDGLTCLLTDKSKVSHGANKVIQSVTEIASLQVQETNLSQEDLEYLQESVSEFEQGLFNLLNKDDLQFKNHTSLLKEGLSELFYYMFSLVVWRTDIKVHLKNIFVALLKVITAVIADSGVEKEDLQNIQNSLHNALETKIYCYMCKTVKHDACKCSNRFDRLQYASNILPTNTSACSAVSGVIASEEINFKKSQNNIEKEEKIALNPEQLQIKNSFNSIINNLVKILLHPSKICFSYMKSIFFAVVEIIQAIFADGKVDGQDIVNIQVALENLERKSNNYIY